MGNKKVETTTRTVGIPDGLNAHAIGAWWYAGEVSKACEDAGQDYEFTCFIRDLYDAYPLEYEFYIEVTNWENDDGI
jgi:hypothetical protein